MTDILKNILVFLTRTRGIGRLHWTDYVSYFYLFISLIIILGPVFWLAASSFKSEGQIEEFPPRILPYTTLTAQVDGYDDPLPIYKITGGEHAGKQLLQISRIGIQANMIDPDKPKEIIKVNIKHRQAVEEVDFNLKNYKAVFEKFDFGIYLWNSTFIVVVSVLLALFVNSMAAFALSKYDFKGRDFIIGAIVVVIIIPNTVLLVPLFMVTQGLGLFDSLWGAIVPTLAVPIGIFLLRQYMLTIPDEILDAARMDKANEWQIYWRVVLPLSAPAIAVFAILITVWRWNDFLWPLVILSSQENFTLQLALNSFQGEYETIWSELLAMTMLVLMPVVIVFLFLQKYIIAGVASSGVK